MWYEDGMGPNGIHCYAKSPTGGGCLRSTRHEGSHAFKCPMCLRLENESRAAGKWQSMDRVIDSGVIIVHLVELKGHVPERAGRGMCGGDLHEPNVDAYGPRR